jgi:hypothetical protein
MLQKLGRRAVTARYTLRYVTCSTQQGVGTPLYTYVVLVATSW